MSEADLGSAGPISAAAFGIDIGTTEQHTRWLGRVEHAMQTDPQGCFVAEAGGRLVGVAQVILREGLWILSLLTVDPLRQNAGAGRALVRRALDYGPSGAPGLIISSNDHRALRLYGQAGFSLRPAFQAEGRVERSALPAIGMRVLEDDAPDLQALEGVSRMVRGASHTAELEFVLSRGAKLLRVADRGFAVHQPGHGPWLLAARDEETAVALLWSAFALVPDGEHCAVRWIQGGQDWAVETVLRAGLRLSAYGAVCTRGEVGPLRPFIPSAPFG